MIRKLVVVLLTGVICLLGVTSALAVKYNEAPMLRVKVAAGELPPVEERLPDEPVVIEPVEEIGQYGGTWHKIITSAADVRLNDRMGYEPLIRWARDGKTVIPGAIKGWEVSKDGKIYTFYLRKGMKWSDGKPFTADDLMFWYEDVLLNEELTPAFPSKFKTVGIPMKVEKVDDYTVTFNFAGSYGTFLQELAATSFSEWSYPKHYLKKFHPTYTSKEKLEKLVEESGLKFWYQLFQNKASEPAICGDPERPTLAAWKIKIGPPATLEIAERNPYYWKVDPEGNQLPYIDRIAFQLVESNEMVSMKAMTGEVSMQLRHIDFADYTLFMKNREKGNYRVLNWMQGESGITLIPNQTLQEDDVLRDLLCDIKFRKALSLAINREEVNELLYFGLAQPVETVLLPGCESLWNEEELLAPYHEYSVEKANKLLDQIGLKWDKNQKYRLRPDGKVLSLIIEVSSMFKTLVDGSHLVAGYWEKNLGIKTSIKTYIYGTMPVTELIQVQGYLMTPVGWVVYPVDYTPCSVANYRWGYGYALWYETMGKSGVEPTGDVKKVMELYEKRKATVNVNEQKRLEKEILELACRNVWSIPCVGFYPQPVIVKENFRNVPEKGINAWPLRTPGYANVEQFYIKQK